MFPISDQVDDAYLSLDREYVLFPQTQVQQMARELALPLHDMTPTLHQQGGRSLYTDYLHLTGTGNDFVASELGDFVAALLR